MAEYDRAIATALRLIKKKGQSATWRVTTAAPVDPNKPWLNGPPVIVDHPAVICFLPITKELRETLTFIRGTEVLGGSVMGLMGQVSFGPSAVDTVVRDGVIYTINNLDILAPSGIPVLYTVEFKV